MVKPKLLFDENIGFSVVSRFQEIGYDVVSILDESPGLSDVKVLERAKAEKRIVVTLDRDFGALVFRDSKKHVGVLFLRMKKETPDAIFLLVKNVLELYGKELEKKFVVLSEDQIRIR